MRPVRIRVERAGEVAERSFTTSPIQIGRNPKADLSLPFEIVSSWHAIIRFDEHEATFFDLGSTNGTEYAGRRIGPGQEVGFDAQPVQLSIGEITLTLSRVDTSSAAAASVSGTFLAAPTEELDRPSPRVEALLSRLHPYYEQLDVVRHHFEDALSRELAALPAEERDAASEWVHRAYPPSHGVTRHHGGGGGG
ncbi:MAG: FHA domain-containing protein, partial [Myxococcales bacterium]|nr:FHA domain-containing protein [Myxococcales bacterium]